MNSRDYWAKREEDALKNYITDEEEYNRQLRRIYENMLDSIQKEINSFYGRYADREGITLAEARKRISQADIRAYERKAEKYVAEKNFSKRANEEMRLYNATMRINRLEMLKANIGLELCAGHDELDRFMGDVLKGRTMEELERQAGILGRTIRNNAKLANSIVNASFHNATFSDRIWMYQDLMKADLSSLLQTGLIQGKNSRVLAKELEKKFEVSRYNAERLMQTELARVQTDAQKRSFEENGFEEYQFIVNAGCCDICAALSDKVFKVKDMMPGKNAPPMHPHCRCSTAAYEDGKEYEAWLDYLENGGTTEQWNAWKKQIESGNINTGHLSFGTNDVDLKYIQSSEYRNKFSHITDNSAVNDKIRKFSSGTLTKFSGTDTECLIVLDADTGKEVFRKTGNRNNLGIELSMDEIETIRKYNGRKIGVHNHPSNLYPTGSDFASAGYRGYDFGIIAGHDGRVYMYSAGKTPFSSTLVDARIDKYCRDAYNESEKRAAYKKALDELSKEYGITWEEL